MYVRKVVHALDHNSIVVMDSVSQMNESWKGSIIVCGSHGGESAAGYLLQFNPGGAILNDAGIGKENSGIKGLELLSAVGVPAATVDAFSSRIGDGDDTYESGIISAVNREAEECGISVGMTAREAAMRMLRREGKWAGKSR